jgi:hypothetical protein
MFYTLSVGSCLTILKIVVNTYYYRYARGVLKILGSVDKMMKKCDVDGDDAIGIDYDMSHNSETCLATCFKRRAFKSAFFPDCEL